MGAVNKKREVKPKVDNIVKLKKYLENKEKSKKHGVN
jgi:hypothetical protein